MSLGLCCQWIEPRTKRTGQIVHENIVGERILQLGRFRDGKYSVSDISSVYHNNVDQHLKLIEKLVSNNIRVFRMTSNMFPLWEFNRELVENDEILMKKLKKLGRSFVDNAIRVTCHPGQFCIINSNEDRVISNAITELEYHAWMFDHMGLKHSPYYAINIHGGKRGNVSKLIDTINNLLPHNVRSRLTLENDERCFSVRQLKDVFLETGVPIVFDSHHFVFNQDGMTMEEAFWLSHDTWLANNEKTLQHISNTEPGNENGSFTERRKHSWAIHYVPEVQLQALQNDMIDLDVEAKGKNISLLKMRKDFQVQ